MARVASLRIQLTVFREGDGARQESLRVLAASQHQRKKQQERSHDDSLIESANASPLSIFVLELRLAGAAHDDRRKLHFRGRRHRTHDLEGLERRVVAQ
jgi:hypothetical protein